MTFILELLEGPSAGRRFELAGPCEYRFGRAADREPAGFRLGSSDLAVSRLHFVVEAGLDECRVRDAGSANGTFVTRGWRPERRLSGPWALRRGDILRAGSVLLEFLGPEPAAGGRGGRRVSATAGGARWPILGRAALRGRSRKPRRCGACGAELPAAEADVLDSPLRAAGSAGGVGEAPGRLCAECAYHLAAEPGAGREIRGWLDLGPVGRGAMGVVRKVWNARTCRVAALKEVASERRGSAAAARRFLQEVEAMRALRHPNVVALLDHGRDEGADYFVSEYVAGGDLEARLAVGGGRLEPAAAAAVLLDALAGLARVHAAGFVHRDLKPSNILLAGGAPGGGRDDPGPPVAKIADFGLSKPFGRDEEGGATRTGETLGTVLYMAPEQVRDFRGAGPRADLYSLAVAAYRSLTGLFPFRAQPGIGRSGLRGYLEALLEEPPVPLAERAEGLPRGFCEAVDRALAKDPGDRWPDARAFRRALARSLGGRAAEDRAAPRGGAG